MGDRVVAKEAAKQQGDALKYASSELKTTEKFYTSVRLRGARAASCRNGGCQATGPIAAAARQESQWRPSSST
eukprot:7315983-Heterocapsa_arctica.AAC.1